MAYDDLYNFVPLRKGMSNAKVCTDDKSLCCLAEFVADLTDTTVFSLGIFLHYIIFIISLYCLRCFQGRPLQRWKYCRTI